jgi:hypothetical protein
MEGSEIIVQISCGRFGWCLLHFDCLAGVSKLLTLQLGTPANKSTAMATCNSICMHFTWRQFGPSGNRAITFSATEVDEAIFHRTDIDLALA